MRDFSGSPMVKNLSCNAKNDSLIPGQGTKIPYAMGQLSLWAATTEPVCHNYRAHTLWSLHATTKEKPAHCNEEPMHHNERSCVLQLRPDAANK